MPGRGGTHGSSCPRGCPAPRTGRRTATGRACSAPRAYVSIGAPSSAADGPAPFGVRRGYAATVVGSAVARLNQISSAAPPVDQARCAARVIRLRSRLRLRSRRRSMRSPARRLAKTARHVSHCPHRTRQCTSARSIGSIRKSRTASESHTGQARSQRAKVSRSLTTRAASRLRPAPASARTSVRSGAPHRCAVVVARRGARQRDACHPAADARARHAPKGAPP
jgi:hypothetical protein